MPRADAANNFLAKFGKSQTEKKMLAKKEAGFELPSTLQALLTNKIIDHASKGQKVLQSLPKKKEEKYLEFPMALAQATN